MNNTKTKKLLLKVAECFYEAAYLVEQGYSPSSNLNDITNDGICRAIDVLNDSDPNFNCPDSDIADLIRIFSPQNWVDPNYPPSNYLPVVDFSITDVKLSDGLGFLLDAYQQRQLLVESLNVRAMFCEFIAHSL